MRNVVRATSTSDSHFHSFSATCSTDRRSKCVFHHDAMCVWGYVLTSWAQSFHRFLPPFFVFHGRWVLWRCLLYPLDFSSFPLPSLFFLSIFCLSQTVVREIRPVSNFGHANIRWLGRRVTASSTALPTSQFDVQMIEHFANVILVCV